MIDYDILDKLTCPKRVMTSAFSSEDKICNGEKLWACFDTDDSISISNVPNKLFLGYVVSNSEHILYVQLERHIPTRDQFIIWKQVEDMYDKL